MQREELLRKIGNVEQIACIQQRRQVGGRAHGQSIWEIDNGVLCFEVLSDRALDLFRFCYRGQNIAFISKPGLDGRSDLDAGVRSIAGGMMFTCGLRNVGPPYTAEEAMHGRIRTTPADNVCKKGFWQGDTYHMELSGETREATLFGENLLLKRSIQTKYGSASLRLQDQIENQSWETTPLMMLYHFNLSYPLIDHDTILHVPAYHTQGRDVRAQDGIKNWENMQQPEDQWAEQVFYHRLASDENGHTLAAAVNKRLNLAFWLRYNVAELPILCQWKSMQSGDYVLGIEPSNCIPEGRVKSQQHGLLHTLPPMGIQQHNLQLGIAEGSVIDKLIDEIDFLRNSGSRS